MALLVFFYHAACGVCIPSLGWFAGLYGYVLGDTENYVIVNNGLRLPQRVHYISPVIYIHDFSIACSQQQWFLS